jgi:peptidoglycan/xylan/chitin deacetylase (PgdA/CDA1 family)
MDNMGEAQELEFGEWPSAKPIGQHHSVVEQLPAMLKILKRHEVQVTYFVEAWNTDVYPEAIGHVLDQGHEIGLHGFRHETWSGLDPETEEGLVARSVERFADLGVPLKGFRPPGGGLNRDLTRILDAHGITYSSPAGRNAAIHNDHVVIPFRWHWIDAFCYFEPLGRMREAAGYPHDILGPDVLQEIIDSCLAEIVDTGGYAALLFHPVLNTSPDRLEVMDSVIQQVQSDTRVWCAPCEQVADWIRKNPEHFSLDAELTDQSWMGPEPGSSSALSS